MIALRDMIEKDIEDNVRWFTKETEWVYWDCPKDPFEPGTEAEERAIWCEYYEYMKDIPDNCKRKKFEIDRDGCHIGWVCAYNELEFYSMAEDGIAIGIIIPEKENRANGAGTEALQKYIEYLHSHGDGFFYLETWSGNIPMLTVAKKLGFKEVCRKEDLREVDGKSYDALVLLLDMACRSI